MTSRAEVPGELLCAPCSVVGCGLRATSQTSRLFRLAPDHSLPAPRSAANYAGKLTFILMIPVKRVTTASREQSSPPVAAAVVAR